VRHSDVAYTDSTLPVGLSFAKTRNFEPRRHFRDRLARYLWPWSSGSCKDFGWSLSSLAAIVPSRSRTLPSLRVVASENGAVRSR